MLHFVFHTLEFFLCKVRDCDTVASWSEEAELDLRNKYSRSKGGWGDSYAVTQAFLPFHMGPAKIDVREKLVFLPFLLLLLLSSGPIRQDLKWFIICILIVL